MTNENMLTITDLKNKWILSCAQREPEGALVTENWKRMQPKYRAACVPVDRPCVVITAKEVAVFEEPEALHLLGMWLVDMSLELAAELGQDIEYDDMEDDELDMEEF
jgi:hypothetical protein